MYMCEYIYIYIYIYYVSLPLVDVVGAGVWGGGRVGGGRGVTLHTMWDGGEGGHEHETWDHI